MHECIHSDAEVHRHPVSTLINNLLGVHELQLKNTYLAVHYKVYYMVFLFNVFIFHLPNYITSSETQGLYWLFIHVLQGIFQNAGNSPNINTKLVIKDEVFCTIIFQALTLKYLLSLA